MARTITIELSDEQYAALEARAREEGKTVEAVAAAHLPAESPVEDDEAKKARFLAAIEDMRKLAAEQPPMTSEEFQQFLEECRQERDARPRLPWDRE